MFKINDKQYFTCIPLKFLSCINPFYEQRDIDKSRLPAIIKSFKEDIVKNGYISFDTSIVLLRTMENPILIDKMGKRVDQVIIDGQHRIAAIKELLKTKSKIGELKVPVMVHNVDDLSQARHIQYRIFEQKPLDACDKIRKSSYNITDMIDEFVLEFNTRHSALAKRYLKEGRYDDGIHRPRKFHFLKDELKHCIRNSPNIEKWISREIQPSELLEQIFTIQRDKLKEFNSLSDISRKMKMVSIKTTKNYSNFISMLSDKEFQILPYSYYKKYNQLLNDIEVNLGIIVDDDGDLSDDDQSEDNEFKECK